MVCVCVKGVRVVKCIDDGAQVSEDWKANELAANGG